VQLSQWPHSVRVSAVEDVHEERERGMKMPKSYLKNKSEVEEKSKHIHRLCE
jgi:hypothetical protein